MKPRQPFKILYGITKSNMGGAQRYVFDLATASRSLGHHVSVLCGGEGTLVKKLEAEHIRVISLPLLKRDVSLFSDIRVFLFILKTLRQERPDVFHVNSSKMGLGVLAGRIMGIKKIIFTLHGFPWNENRPGWQKIIMKFLIWLTILLSHKTICVAEKAKQNVSGFLFIKNKLVVVPNGISPFTLAPRMDTTFTVGTIAELHRIKGLDVLLTAWSGFIKNHKAKLVVIGDGEEKENLRNMAINMGITKSVFFGGFIDNARSLLQNFDIFVLPSRSEAMPYAVLEAGLASRAVIATSVGGIPEIIENNANGLLIPAGNPGALLSALNRLTENPDTRRTFGEHLKKTVETKFSMDTMVRDTINIYA